MSGIVGGINLRSSGLVNNSSASDGQVFTGTGAGLPAGFEAAAGGGAWNFLSTATASASATIDFTSSIITSTYDQYMVTLTNIKPDTDATNFLFRVSVSSTFITSGYPEAGMYFNNAAGTPAMNAGYANSSSPAIGLNSFVDSNHLGTATDEQYNGSLFIYNPTNASHYTCVTGYCVYETDGGLFTTGQMGGHYPATSAVDGIRFYMTSGNIASGVFRVYGLANS